MKFDIYRDYEVWITKSFSYYDIDGDIVSESEEIKQSMDGASLAKFIANFMRDDDFSSISITDEKIIITLFCPMDGTGQDLDITIFNL